MPAKKEKSENRTVAQNRKARYDYHLEEIFEAGIELKGTEVKSLRAGGASINESYAAVGDNREVFLYNCYIPEYKNATASTNHEPRRARKLLLHKKQINKLIGALEKKGYTLVPLSIYFTRKGKAKMGIALGKGKTKYDKREAIKKQDWQREKARSLRDEE